jgi:hypothetical protein
VIDVTAAIAERYNATDLSGRLNGFFVGTAWPNTDRPYAVALPLTDVPLSQTNRAKYRQATFTVEVLADDYDAATRLAYLVRERMTKPPLEFSAAALPWDVPGGRLLRLSEGTFTWIEEDQYWRVVVEFTADVTRG